ncbi:MAG TPA: biotin/lipoyl-binding protein [Bryobacteraceae bacterium]|nr:biotin/lipoyl-binding protein [Bryobacteraceae bacterium]
MTENKQAPRKGWRLRLVPVLAVLAALVSGALVIERIESQPRTADAEVIANFIGIAPVVEGPIVKLAVRDNQLVKQGDLLFEIDDAPYRYALENAKAELAALEGQIANERRHIGSQTSAAVAAQAATRSAGASLLQSGAMVEQARADVIHSEAVIKQAIAEWEYSNNNLHRLEPLLGKQFVTVDQVDQARSATRAKDEAVRQAEAQLRLSQARLNSALAEQEQSQATLEQSHAQATQSERAIDILEPLLAQRGSRASAIRTAQYNFDHCRVYAPFAARVTNLTISEGAYARIGQQLFTLIDTRTWWVAANYRETELKNIRPGMPADVYLMSKAEQHFHGVVDSTGYGVTFDPSVVGTLTQQGLPDTQRTLNWVHLASRYPVRIRILNPVGELLRVGENAAVIVRSNRTDALAR